MHRRIPMTAVLAVFALFLLGAPGASAAQSARRTPLDYRETHALPGVRMWRKGTREYVQIVSPAEGGRIKLLTGEVRPSMYPGTTFARRDIRDWWTHWKTADANAFSVANGQFFNMGDPAKAPLAFSTKVDGVIHPGYGDAEEYPQGKLVLLLGEGAYDIEPYGDDAAVLFARAEREALVGLKPDMSKKAARRVGRTFLGVNAAGEAIILTTPGGTQRYATRILTAFGAERHKIMMLDGGGSAQLVTDKGLLVPSRGGDLRTVPQAIGVASGR